MAGMSKSLEKDMHKEVLLEQRNLLMRIRMDDPESRKYEIQHSGFDMELVEKKMKQKQNDKFDRNSKNRQVSDFKRFNQQKNSSREFLDYKISESEHWLVVYPSRVRPLCEEGAQEVTHFQLIPKEHYTSSMELDEEVSKDL